MNILHKQISHMSDHSTSQKTPKHLLTDADSSTDTKQSKICRKSNFFCLAILHPL